MILHFGLGAFHRAHQAVHTQEAGDGWWIRAVAPRSAEIVEALRAQAHRYTVLVRDGRQVTSVPVASIRQALHAPTDTPEVLELVADPAVRVITLTITEKAYADLSPSGPIGLLAAGLARRTAPVAVVSCDNLLDNGRRTREAVAKAGAADLGHVTFPATVVDRMVPATTPADRAYARDRAVVVAEPYSQWVLQDEFPAGRPAWERAGAVFAADVEPYERAKLRILNGVHSALAYTGALTGHEHISDTLADPALSRLAVLLLEDVLPTLTPPPGLDLAAYGESVLGRMRNTALRHRCDQVAQDGSLKVPIRLLGTVRDALAAGTVPRWTCLAVAAWLRHVTVSVSDAGLPVVVTDPAADHLRSLSGDLGHLLAAVAPDLAEHQAFRSQVAADLAAFAKHGVGHVISCISH
ncbi:mannitol dehydrogenase family protein [Nonomuraea aridisoli]|uniref:mannitol dehydrogenase family protein n=1 Tax=Nonomuraea aridisoli TaxID=2070368 RepID=UPI0015E8E2EA|nr:mannitol dehydrogenase family protein [Nonomuraea aridisoli]